MLPIAEGVGKYIIILDHLWHKARSMENPLRNELTSNLLIKWPDSEISQPVHISQ